jgi:hypothetical protein
MGLGKDHALRRVLLLPPVALGEVVAGGGVVGVVVKPDTDEALASAKRSRIVLVVIEVVVIMIVWQMWKPRVFGCGVVCVSWSEGFFLLRSRFWFL